MMRLPARLQALTLLLILPLAAGCFRIPKIIVLEDPLTAAEHLDLGVAYERKGELDLALREYEKAVRKDGSLFKGRFNLGNVFLAKKDFGKARAEYLLALELRPGDPDATNNLAWSAIMSGEGLVDSLRGMEAVTAGKAGRTGPLLDTLGVLYERLDRPLDASIAFSEAERACEARNASGEAGCPEAVRKEIEDHRRELLRRFPRPDPPPLVK